jgi:hypothetical protein
VLRSGAVDLCLDDDLVLRVDRGDPGVALDDALECCHLGALVVGTIALAIPPLRAAPVVGVVLRPCPQFGGVAPLLLDASRFPGSDIRLRVTRVIASMSRQHRLRCGFELGRLALEVRAGPAPCFARVARELHAVDGEHLASDQSLTVAQVEDLRENVGDFIAEASDKGGDRRRMWGVIVGQRHEGNVFAAVTLEGAAADDAARVGERRDFKEHGRRIGRGAAVVVAVADVEAAEVEFVLDQVRERVLESAGHKMQGRVHRQELRIGVDVLVTGHRWGIPRGNRMAGYSSGLVV